MDAWSQAMIDGIDTAIDDMMPVVTRHPNGSILGVLLAAGQSIESIRANIKLAISGGQNEPRDAISCAMVADVALPSLFERLKGLRLDAPEQVKIGGWAFRGLLSLPVRWEIN